MLVSRWLARCALIVGAPLVAQPTAPDPDFFEREVRPVLAQRCQSCHGGKTQKSELRLDHGSFVLRGGARGPAVNPTVPAESLLLRAIEYRDVDLQMPPKGRLADAELAVLRRWVAAGALWPDEPTPQASTGTKFDLAARRAAHWCWKPPTWPTPPDVADPSWPRDSVDLFVQRGLEDLGLSPAPEADRATWLRRVTFALWGLPPTPAELTEFHADRSPHAHAQVVDRLLGAPQFAERWARHWLDLVRYAETLGHEFDFVVPQAWRYRDYVVRALDRDLPYDQFVREHIAGDLLPEPRRGPDGLNESLLGTCFYWFGDQVHAPVDVRKHQADRLDNQLDVLGKTFLGLTVSCARCHDHKFDAIAQRDYYALTGVLKDSRYALTPLLPHGGHHDVNAALEQLAPRLRQEVAARWQTEADRLTTYLTAVATLPPPPRRQDREPHATFDARVAADDLALARAARAHDLDIPRLRRWRELARQGHGDEHPLQAFAAYLEAGTHWPARAEELATPRQLPTNRADERVVGDFRRDHFDGWRTVGEAFGAAPRHHDVLALDEHGHIVARVFTRPVAQSAGASLRLQGTLHSPTFTIDRRFLWLRASGERCRINVVVEGFHVIRDPIYGGLRRWLDSAHPTWLRFDLAAWRGMQAFVQVHDLRTKDPGDEGGAPPAGYAAVEQVLLSDSEESPSADAERAAVALLRAALPDAAPLPPSATELAQAYARATTRALTTWREGGQFDEPTARWFNFLARERLLDDDHAGPAQRLARGLDSAIAEVPCVPAMTDGPGLDEHLYVRGSHAQLGALVPRAGLTALDTDPAAYRSGSGRLALAHELTRPDHPLLARVLVNRVWHHLFGQGLVATPDNFGALGEAPSHPELLDRLARELVADGWSLKRLIRRLCLSATYRMASTSTDPHGAERDPTLRALHHMPVRRLDGEALRDGLLLLAGRLDHKRFGPSVPVHLTPFMDGRGRPDRSGPLDGAGRRSIYQEVRRNFLSPLFLAFDTPIPFGTVGRRNVSNVPAQALALMNDPFVQEMARSMAERLLRDPGDAKARAATLQRLLWQREPREEEVTWAATFVGAQASALGVDSDAVAPWADLAHVLINTKDFLFVR